MLKLYFIHAQASLGDADGPHNLDLFVSAKSARSAVNLWKKYYDDMADEADNNIVRVWEVPAMGAAPVAHAWDALKEQKIIP